MTYGMLAARSSLLTDIVDQLYEDSKKVNSLERLTRHLNKGVPDKALRTYLATVRKFATSEPAIHIDDSDVVKPDVYKFEFLGFVMDRGYDDNRMFLKLDELKQDYVIRPTAKRKLFFHGKWIPATQLRDQRKGKIKTPLIYKGKRHDAHLSHVKVRITASRKDICLVFVYGITGHPMMLATNKEIRSKEDVIRIAELYFSRWRIE